MLNKTLVSDCMLPVSRVAITSSDASLKKALELMTEYSLGVCIFKSESGKLEGILTDGDLRRLILNVQNPLPALLVSYAIDFGTRNLQTVQDDEDLLVAIQLMDEKRIWDLPVVNKDGAILGLLNRHNLG
jgi:CBS domain-containing protein